MLAVASIAAIELRFVPSLWPAHDVATSNAWNFSVVRWARRTARAEAANDPTETVHCLERMTFGYVVRMSCRRTIDLLADDLGTSRSSCSNP